MVVLAAAALVAAGCNGGGANKVGGASSTTPTNAVTLTLLTGDAIWVPEFAAQVERLSHGTLRIDATVAGNQPAYEAKTVEAVRAGKADLGAVGARAWDAFGVTSFRAVVAPFLVDSLALEQRVLAGPLARQMLRGLDRAGFVGLALLPGPLRRPLGLSRVLVAPSDYRGARFGIRYGGVARSTVAALGATPKGYVVGHIPAGFDGAELDLNTIAENGYDAQARALTANVVLWPRPQTIFASRAAFDRLTPEQRQILVAAGRAAIEPEVARVRKDEAAGLGGVCRRGHMRLLTASPSQLAALRRSVRSVYASLARDPGTRRAIAAIRRLRGPGAVQTVACPHRRASSASSDLNGVWQAASGYDELVAAGVAPAEAERQRGARTLTFSDGEWVGRELESGFTWRGRYYVDGNELRLVSNSCPRDVPCAARAIAAFTWSVYDDRLSLALLSGTPGYFAIYATPLTRVR